MDVSGFSKFYIALSILKLWLPRHTHCLQTQVTNLCRGNSFSSPRYPVISQDVTVHRDWERWMKITTNPTLLRSPATYSADTKQLWKRQSLQFALFSTQVEKTITAFALFSTQVASMVTMLEVLHQWPPLYEAHKSCTTLREESWLKAYSTPWVCKSCRRQHQLFSVLSRKITKAYFIFQHQ